MSTALSVFASGCGREVEDESSEVESAATEIGKQIFISVATELVLKGIEIVGNHGREYMERRERERQEQEAREREGDAAIPDDYDRPWNQGGNDDGYNGPWAPSSRVHSLVAGSTASPFQEETFRLASAGHKIPNVWVSLGNMIGGPGVDALVVRGNKYHFRGRDPIAFGNEGDLPIVVDLDQDGQSELLLYRMSNSHFYSTSGLDVAYGEPGDVPIVGDYDRDGKIDVGVYRPSEATFYVRDVFDEGVRFGERGDFPVIGSFRRKDLTDIAVYRPMNSTFYIRYRRNVAEIPYGEPGDIPVCADFDGDGLTDIAVYRPSTQRFYIRGIRDRGVQYGEPGAIPIVADWDGDGKADIAVNHWWESTFNVRGGETFQFGDANDVPGRFFGRRLEAESQGHVPGGIEHTPGACRHGNC
jgi:hypothetical protein